MPGVFGLGGHLGAAVSALVDGQLEQDSEERAWAHVAVCPACRRAVEQEGWTKRQLHLVAGGEPSARLLGSLYDLDASLVPAPTPEHAVRESWAAVERLEQQGRGRRRAGLAAIGVGSVSAAVLGLSTLSGASLGIGGAPVRPPSASVTGSPAAPTSAATAGPRRASHPARAGSTRWLLTPSPGSTHQVGLTPDR